jgi:hypothetical protein
LSIDETAVVREIYEPRDKNEDYQDALSQFKAAVESKDIIKIADAAVWLETVACDFVYKKGFHDGMRFILSAMAGKEVIDI